jgi:cytochrome b561
MQDTGLFLSLAEIAGVFVGFGALIAMRSSGPSEAQEISHMRAVVVMGMLTIVAALAPVVLDRYGVAGHQAWALSAVLALVGFLVMAGAMARTPEYRASWAT